MSLTVPRRLGFDSGDDVTAQTRLSDGGEQLSLFDGADLRGQTAADGRPRRSGSASIDYAPARDILTRATGFIDSYDYTLNPYSGCSFACSYCYAAFFSRDHSPDDWGKWVTVKENAVQLLRRRRAKLHGKLIYMSSVTDPYQPIERKLGLTRALLEVMAEASPPRLVVQTRSPDATRDIDLYRRIVEQGGRVRVNITVTTDDEDIRRAFEPSCPGNEQRIKAARELCDAGISTCITMTPLLLVRDAPAFAEALRRTGVRKFVVQPFQFHRSKFVAGTREAAQSLMAEKLDCARAAFRERYLSHYESVRSVLWDRLPGLSEGKAGFAPGF